ncbi:MAG: aspartate carbamoyltransferase catalytic subunit [Verrucomicrobiota bacterium]
MLDLQSLSRNDVEGILEQAQPFKEVFQRSVKKVPALKGKTVLMLFYEPSTRTLSSFEVAAKRLSADVTLLDVPNSSVTKGESVKDTVDTLQAMRADYIVVRHQMPGLPGRIARQTGASVISAGDGAHAHPTQGLLDAFTLREVYPEGRGKKVLVVGDIRHSRVARSTTTVLRKLGYEVGFLGPGTLVPEVEGIARFTSFEEAWRWDPDVFYLLRVQRERQGSQFFPSVGEYHKVYGVTVPRFERIAAEGKWVMHPGPVNRGVELCDGVMDYERSLINQQVENGIAVRMAALYLLKPKLTEL